LNSGEVVEGGNHAHMPDGMGRSPLAGEVLGEPDPATAVAYHVDADVREGPGEEVAAVAVVRRLLVEHRGVAALGGGGDRGGGVGVEAGVGDVLADGGPSHALRTDAVTELCLVGAEVRQPAPGNHHQVVLVRAGDQAGQHRVRA